MVVRLPTDPHASPLTLSNSVAILGQLEAPGLGRDLNQIVSSQLTQR